MITVLGALFLVAAAVTLLRWRSAFVWVLGASAAFPHSAAVRLGDNGLSCFHLLAAIAAVYVLVLLVTGRWRPTRRSERWSLIVLGVFVVYSIAITGLGPLLFHDLPVFSPRGGIDQQVGAMTPLTYSISNAAQAGYVLLGVAVVCYLLSRPALPRGALELPLALGIGLGLIRAALGPLWPEWLFDTMPNVSYPIEEDRLRGAFGEPSMFGAFIVACLAYALYSAVLASGRRRWYLAVLAVGAAIAAVLNTSGTVATGGVAIAVTVVLMLLVAWWRRGARGWMVAGAAGCVVVVALAVAASPLGSAAVAFVSDKLGSLSYANRTAADQRGYEIFAQTWGLGVGLGSNRPSGLLAMLLSCVGLVGAVAFTALLLRTALRDVAVRTSLPLGIALLCLAVAQYASVPDLSFPPLWLLMGFALREANAVGQRTGELLRACLARRQGRHSVITGAPIGSVSVSDTSGRR